MSQNNKEFVGSFTVVNSKQEIREVIVSQERVTHYSSSESHSKKLNLDSIDGIEVYKTSDPDVFMLSDGSILKRKKVAALRS